MMNKIQATMHTCMQGGRGVHFACLRQQSFFPCGFLSVSVHDMYHESQCVRYVQVFWLLYNIHPCYVRNTVVVNNCGFMFLILLHVCTWKDIDHTPVFVCVCVCVCVYSIDMYTHACRRSYTCSMLTPYSCTHMHMYMYMYMDIHEHTHVYTWYVLASIKGGRCFFVLG